jgi:hypothetical protein
MFRYNKSRGSVMILDFNKKYNAKEIVNYKICNICNSNIHLDNIFTYNCFCYKCNYTICFIPVEHKDIALYQIKIISGSKEIFINNSTNKNLKTNRIKIPEINRYLPTDISTILKKVINYIILSENL